MIVNKVYNRIESITGSVITVKASGVSYKELAEIKTRFGKSLAQVNKIDGDIVSLQVFAGGQGVSTGDEVRFLGRDMRVSFSDDLLGRIFNGSGEPRDSSSAAIAVCAMLEAIKHMDEDDPQRQVFVNACNRIMNSLIDRYTTKWLPQANGLLLHGTYSKPNGSGIDEMPSWGDYFYMEALHRMLDPDWEMYW